eukprot:4044283-Prymnesium_polylepis.2
MIRMCPLFKNADRNLVASLSVTVVPEVYLPAQFIRVAGYVSRSMFFIERGRVQIILKVPSEMRGFHIVECETHFDMLALFIESRNISIRSITHTDCFRYRADL